MVNNNVIFKYGETVNYISIVKSKNNEPEYKMYWNCTVISSDEYNEENNSRMVIFRDRGSKELPESKEIDMELRNLLIQTGIINPKSKYDYYNFCWEPINKLISCDQEEKETKENYYDDHYQSEHQPIETMQANMTEEEFEGFLRGNIIKYACRYGKKDEKKKEAEKIKRYAEWLEQVVNGETINPRK